MLFLFSMDMSSIYEFIWNPQENQEISENFVVLYIPNNNKDFRKCFILVTNYSCTSPNFRITCESKIKTKLVYCDLSCNVMQTCSWVPTFFRDLGTHLQVYMVSQPRRQHIYLHCHEDIKSQNEMC